MTAPIRILFVGPPCKSSVENQKLIASHCLPVEGHFEASAEEAMAYLKRVARNRFPDVVLVDEQIGEQPVVDFVRYYRQVHYAHQVDTSIFIGHTTDIPPGWVAALPLISGTIRLPLTKTAFLNQIYPRIFVRVY